MSAPDDDEDWDHHPDDEVDDDDDYEDDDDDRALQGKWIGSITPRSQGGRCVFLDEQDRCRIHAVAPFGCAYYDTHMDVAEATAARHGRCLGGSRTHTSSCGPRWLVDTLVCL